MKNNSFKHFIGIDISKDKFNYAIIDDSMNIINEGQFDMDAQGFNDFNKTLKSYPDSVIALESTGNYHLNLLAFLTANEHTVALINPALIKKFDPAIHYL
jgi:transposase